MKKKDEGTLVKRIGLYMILGIAAAFHFALTFVIALFVLSTLNILNERMLQLENISYIEIPLVCIIFIISIVVFFRSFSKITQFINTTFFRGTI